MEVVPAVEHVPPAVSFILPPTVPLPWPPSVPPALAVPAPPATYAFAEALAALPPGPAAPVPPPGHGLPATESLTIVTLPRAFLEALVVLLS